MCLIEMQDRDRYQFEFPTIDIEMRPKDRKELAALGFEAKRVLGRGTFSVVFLCVNAQNKSFAIKKVYIPKEINPKSHPLLSLPKSQNIIELLDFFE